MCERSDLEEYNPSSWIWVFTDLGWIRTLIRSGMKLFRPSYTFSSLRKFKEHSFIPPCSSTVNMTSDKLILTKSPTIPPSFSCSNASTLSSQESYNVSRVSPLHHPEYKRMTKKLESEAHTNLDVACLHILVRWSQNSLSSLTWILFSGNLKVSQREHWADLKGEHLCGAAAVLNFFGWCLGACSSLATSTCRRIKFSRPTLHLSSRFPVLRKINLNVNFLPRRCWIYLCHYNPSYVAYMQGSGDPLDRDFMFKRQLVGFYLMRGIKDSHLRFPVEALNRLASILYSGNFTKEEDKANLKS